MGVTAIVAMRKTRVQRPWTRMMVSTGLMPRVRRKRLAASQMGGVSPMIQIAVLMRRIWRFGLTDRAAPGRPAARG